MRETRVEKDLEDSALSQLSELWKKTTKLILLRGSENLTTQPKTQPASRTASSAAAVLCEL
jgi:hypothetical protein